ncbi:MAG: hypothetical protein OXF32_02350, partial [Anaerolineaceae bacterium]|nr:hypothetical protein [Anaerolineaceae bacterium]
MRRPVLLLTLLFLLTVLPEPSPVPAQAPLTAQPIPDTLTALAAAEVPARDRVELARRVIGLVDEPPTSLVYAETGEGFSATPAAPPDWQPGDVLRFNVTNEGQNRRFEVEASMRVGGEHVWLWVERGVDVDLTSLQTLADLFDEQVYGPLRALFGSENRPGVDGDPRVYVLFAHG